MARGIGRFVTLRCLCLFVQNSNGKKRKKFFVDLLCVFLISVIESVIDRTLGGRDVRVRVEQPDDADVRSSDSYDPH